ncbi:glycosyltransferase [Blastococcus mobilis]|uniref:Glycosyltransferase involved in cell wall bisynthesis n=1 Tax=Blastococcus mobilis TaxID=1938746 RepID=A0A238W5J1_9ACTN|nr:glycosyltransferase [Blastococcus mobilis]SNR41433.1 Glycosyltransferase involved in cell wall bisynthesis [Blastococcus mobilis]
MSDEITVLQSFPEPRPTTNPYVVMLRRSLEDEPALRVLTFTWRQALLGRYDLFHVHWPEILVSGRSSAKAWVRRALFLALLLRLRLTGTPMVRTLHNLRPQEGVPRPAALLLRLAERWTSLSVRLNETTPVDERSPHVTIPHGHYRDWFAAHQAPPRERHRAVFVGLIRPYKNVDGLIRAFRTTADRAPRVRLQIAGEPASPKLADTLRIAAAGEPRVALSLEFLSDERLVEAVSRAELVVLPYREMHNSGAALMALSLDRPVLLPDNEVNARLAAEVGADWVIRYDGELTGQVLLAALEEAGHIPPEARPDLSRREWDRTGADHTAAYRLALQVPGRRVPGA